MAAQILSFKIFRDAPFLLFVALNKRDVVSHRILYRRRL